MNKEKLLEIAESAGFILTDDKNSVDWSSNYDDALVNFSKLIVRECVQVACPKLIDVGERDASMCLAQKRLKEHFGVE